MSLFEFMGIRFGWSSVIGLIPELGDIVDAYMAVRLMSKCNKIEGGLPKNIKSKMLMYIMLDFVVGLVLFLGDLLDASIKANTWNCRLLEEHLDRRYKPKADVEGERRQREEARRSGIDYYPPAPATVYDDISDEELPPQYSTRPASPSGQGPSQQAPKYPAASRHADERRGGERTDRPSQRSGGGWFSRGRSRRDRAADVETGQLSTNVATA